MLAGMSTAVKMMHEIQGNVLKGTLSVFMAMINCSKETIDCVVKLAVAAPRACILGMRIRLISMFTIIPIAAVMFNNFMLPLAVSRVPKMYVNAMGMMPGMSRKEKSHENE